MALIGMSDDLCVHTFVTCIICLRRVPSTQVTAGVSPHSGRHAFACNRHVVERGAWIYTWAQTHGVHSRTGHHATGDGQ